MANIIAKSESVYARVDPETKSQAESILKQIGLPISTAIGMFYKQIILKNGLPFEAKAAPQPPLCLENLTEKEFEAELQKGIDDINAGRVYSLEEVKKEMEEEIKSWDVN